MERKRKNKLKAKKTIDEQSEFSDYPDQYKPAEESHAKTYLKGSKIAQLFK